jgi:hypothetical protein
MSEFAVKPLVYLSIPQKREKERLLEKCHRSQYRISKTQKQRTDVFIP